MIFSNIVFPIEAGLSGNVYYDSPQSLCFCSISKKRP